MEISDILTLVGQTVVIVLTVIGAIWTKLRSLSNKVGDLDKTCAVGNERLEQIEKRIGGNGASIPSLCRVHETKLADVERRLDRLEPSGK